MTYNLACLLKAGHFSDFKYQSKINKPHKHSEITWEAESMNYTQFHTEKLYIREFGFLPLEIINVKLHQNNQILQEPDMCRWVQIAQERVETSKVCN